MLAIGSAYKQTAGGYNLYFVRDTLESKALSTMGPRFEVWWRRGGFMDKRTQLRLQHGFSCSLAYTSGKDGYSNPCSRLDRFTFIGWLKKWHHSVIRCASWWYYGEHATPYPHCRIHGTSKTGLCNLKAEFMGWSLTWISYPWWANTFPAIILSTASSIQHPLHRFIHLNMCTSNGSQWANLEHTLPNHLEMHRHVSYQALEIISIFGMLSVNKNQHYPTR